MINYTHPRRTQTTAKIVEGASGNRVVLLNRGDSVVIGKTVVRRAVSPVGGRIDYVKR